MTAITRTDAWIEGHIAAGRLAPAAREMDPADAARQHNEANALDPDRPDYLYAPDQAQRCARDLLGAIGIEVGPAVQVVLTDADAGPRLRTHRVNPGQLEFACDQHRLVTGESVCADALIGGLPWA